MSISFRFESKHLYRCENYYKTDKPVLLLTVPNTNTPLILFCRHLDTNYSWEQAHVQSTRYFRNVPIKDEDSSFQNAKKISRVWYWIYSYFAY